MDYFDDEELSTEQMQDIIAKEREEKYKKLESMTDEEIAQYFHEKSVRIHKLAEKLGINVVDVRLKKDNGGV